MPELQVIKKGETQVTTETYKSGDIWSKEKILTFERIFLPEFGGGQPDAVKLPEAVKLPDLPELDAKGGGVGQPGVEINVTFVGQSRLVKFADGSELVLDQFDSIDEAQRPRLAPEGSGGIPGIVQFIKKGTTDVGELTIEKDIVWDVDTVKGLESIRRSDGRTFEMQVGDDLIFGFGDYTLTLKGYFSIPEAERPAILELSLFMPLPAITGVQKMGLKPAVSVEQAEGADDGSSYQDVDTEETPKSKSVGGEIASLVAAQGQSQSSSSSSGGGGGGDGGEASLVAAIGRPPVVSGTSLLVLEADFPTVLGSVSASDPDGDPLTYSLTAPVAPFSSSGTPIVWSGSGTQLLTGMAGGLPVLSVTINNSGAVVLSQTGPIDHLAPGADSLTIPVGVVVNDGRFTASATIKVEVTDDVPAITPPVIPAVIDEDDIPGHSNDTIAGDHVGTGTNVVSGILGIDYGSDGPSAASPVTVVLTSVALVDNPTLASFSGLTSGGNPVTTSWNPTTSTLTGSTIGGTVFTLFVNSTSGAYDFTLLAPLDHPASVYEEDLVLNFTATITDGDGDQASTDFSVTVDDDDRTLVASISAAAGSVFELGFLDITVSLNYVNNTGADITVNLAKGGTAAFGPFGPPNDYHFHGISDVVEPSVVIGNGQQSVTFQLHASENHSTNSLTYTIQSVDNPNVVISPSASQISIQVNDVPPVIIDLDGDGLEFADTLVGFDIDDDGVLEQMTWAGADDGFLAYDENGNGLIDQRGEIVFTEHAPGAATDLEAIRQAFDSDNDGLLTENDEAWDRFGIWQDADLDGVTDEGEFQLLADLEVESIGLIDNGILSYPAPGVTLHGESVLTYEDGTTMTVGNASLVSIDIDVSEILSIDGDVDMGEPSSGENAGIAVENEAVASAGDEMAAAQTQAGAEPAADGSGETDFPVAGGEAPALETETPLAVVA